MNALILALYAVVHPVALARKVRRKRRLDRLYRTDPQAWLREIA